MIWLEFKTICAVPIIRRCDTGKRIVRCVILYCARLWFYTTIANLNAYPSAPGTSPAALHFVWWLHTVVYCSVCAQVFPQLSAAYSPWRFLIDLCIMTEMPAQNKTLGKLVWRRYLAHTSVVAVSSTDLNLWCHVLLLACIFFRIILTHP